MRFEILIVIIVLMLTWPVESTDDNEEEAKSQEQFVQDYQKNLMERRKAHHEVIRRIQELKDAKKEKETVSMLLKKLFEVLVGSLNSLADHVKNTKTNRLEYTPDTMKDISSVIENTAFAADMCLHFPNMFHKLYDTNKEWHPVLESSIGFTIKTGLPDEPTLKAINLMSQELNIIDKEANYSNPYKKKKKSLNDVYKETVDDPIEAKKKKKEKKKRGPGLSGSRADL